MTAFGRVKRGTRDEILVGTQRGSAHSGCVKFVSNRALRATSIFVVVASASGIACKRDADGGSAANERPSPNASEADDRDDGPEPPRTSGEWPKRAASLDEVNKTRKALEVLVRDGATDPEEPWSMAHGIIAFGPKLKAKDARLAADVIVSDFIQRREGEKGETVWFFPDQTPSGNPLQPHDNLIAKVLATSGLSLDRAFPLRTGGEVTLKQIVESAARTFEKPTTAHDWGRQAWTLEALFATQLPGTKIELDGWSPTYTELVGYSVEALDRLQSFLEGPMAADEPQLVEKKKQGIYAHTCGGLHFVQAALRGADRLGAEEPLERAKDELDVVRFRYEAERRIYRATIAQAPKYRTLILVQEMKFFGHLLETFGLAVEWGALTPTPRLSAFLRDVSGDLVDTVRELESAYGQIADYRAQGSQTYYDLIGDGCHAVRGLRLTARHFFEDEG